jgi:hypothetical protein
VTCASVVPRGWRRSYGESLIRVADDALYKAKRAGRDCCQVLGTPKALEPALAAAGLGVSYSQSVTESAGVLGNPL